MQAKLSLMAKMGLGGFAAKETQAAAAEVEYVICPFIDFLNHSSASQVGAAERPAWVRLVHACN